MLKYQRIYAAMNGKSSRSRTFREPVSWLETSAGMDCESASGSGKVDIKE
ncbi:MAG: hypothetical protein IJF02_04020 [Oscillospiraceae bacterium]|nr:hypothetical protein [Oscillospiraceae bacterium]